MYFMTRMQYFNRHCCGNNDRTNKRQLIVSSNFKFKKTLVEPKFIKHRSWVTLFIKQKDSLLDCFKIPSVCAALKIWFNLNLIFLECVYLKIQGTSSLYSVDWYRVAENRSFKSSAPAGAVSKCLNPRFQARASQFVPSALLGHSGCYRKESDCSLLIFSTDALLLPR